MRRRRRWLYGFGIAVVIYALLGFFLAPWLVERTAVETVSKNLGSELRLENVAINPFVLSLTVDGLELDGPAGEPLARIGQIFVNFQLSSIFRRAWTFAGIRFDAPELFLSRDSEGTLNVLKLVPKTPGDEGRPPADTQAAGGLPRLFIYDFSIGTAQVHWRDDVPQEPVETVFGPVTVQVLELNTLPERPGEQAVVITTETAGTLAWAGSIQLNPFASAGRASLDGSPFSLLSAYIRHETGLDVVDGLVDVELDYSVSTEADGTLAAAIDNLGVLFTDVRVNTYDPAPEDPALDGRELLTLPKLGLAGGRLRWPDQKVSAESIEVDGGNISLLRLESGALDIVRLAGGERAPPTQAETEPAGGNPAPGWSVALDRLVVDGFAFGLVDRSVEPHADIGFDAIDLVMEALSNQPAARFPTTLSLDARHGGTIRLQGTTTVLPDPLIEFELQVEGVALEAAHPYLKPLADVNLDSGTVDVDGRVRHAPDELLLFEADVDVLDFLITETDEGTRLGSWDRLHAKGIALSLANESLEISEISFDAPFADVLIAEDGTVNLGRISKEDQAAASQETTDAPADESAAAGEAEPPLAITIGRVVVADGAGIFTDESLPLPFSANIAELAGTLSTIATDSAEPSTAEFEGRVDEYGLVRISGTVTPLDFARATNLDVVFENVEMPKFSAYTVPFAGREIANGKLDLDLGYEVTDRRLVGENRIVLREFELGEKVPHPGAMSLPLGLAVALLKDPSGTIDIDLPIRGDIDDPEFSYGRVIGKALLNLITKIVTSPFALLGNLVGVEAKDLEYINFTAGRAELAPPEIERARKLAEALGQRPQLVLDISGAVHPTVDAEALKRLRVEQAIEQRIGESGESDSPEAGYAERRRVVLEAMYRESVSDNPGALDGLTARFTSTVVDEESGRETEQFDATAYTAELTRQLIEAEPVTDADLGELGRMRAGNARDAVIAADPALESRVRVAPDVAAVSDTDDGSVRMKVSLSAGD